jgi:hypothetical protein
MGMSERDQRMNENEQSNLESFDRLDFVGWNGPDWNLFRRLHTEDVSVDMAGRHTEGIEAHVQMCQAVIASTPDYEIVDHPIRIADGDWTAVVGQLANGNEMLTLARWRDGVVSEEHIFMGGSVG